MSHQVNMHQAKTHLSQLIQNAAAGEEVIIAKAGLPVARLVAYQPPTKPRASGVWRNQVHLPDDFDTLPPELAKAFRGETD